MYKNAFTIALCGILILPFAMASAGNTPADPQQSILIEARKLIRASAANLPSTTFSTFQTTAPMQLSQADVMPHDQQQKQDYLESVAKEAGLTDSTRSQPSASDVDQVPEQTAPAPPPNTDMGRVGNIRSIVTEALADPRPATVNTDESKIAPPVIKGHRQQLQEAVSNAPQPKDSPSDQYISILKHEVSTSLVVEEDEKIVSSEPVHATSSAVQERKSGHIHTVRYGDSLWNIAMLVYGDGHLWDSIYDANRDTIANPDLLVEGQRLIIPSK